MAEKDVKLNDKVTEKLISKYTKTPSITDIHVLEQLKITLDDFLSEYSREKGYKEKHTLTDFKNTVGIISTIQAVIVLIASLYFKFENAKRVLAMAIFSYFAVNIFCIIVSYFFGGKISFIEFEAITRIDSIPTYVILLFWKGRGVPVKYSRSVLELFDETGRLDHVEFLNDLNELFNE